MGRTNSTLKSAGKTLANLRWTLADLGGNEDYLADLGKAATDSLKRAARTLGTAGGRKTSKKKAEASRENLRKAARRGRSRNSKLQVTASVENGKKGGRPPKTVDGQLRLKPIARSLPKDLAFLHRRKPEEQPNPALMKELGLRRLTPLTAKGLTREWHLPDDTFEVLNRAGRGPKDYTPAELLGWLNTIKPEIGCASIKDTIRALRSGMVAKFYEHKRNGTSGF